MTPFRAHYCFLGVSFCLETNLPDLAEQFRRRYGRLATAESSPHPTLTYRVLRADDAAHLLLIPPDDAVPRRAPDLPLARDVLTDWIVQDVLSRAADCLLFHAGALVCNGAGVALAADSRHGKSTLTLALALTGCGFLSDETAAVRLTDGRLLPFPRALGLRRGTIALLGLPPHLAPAAEGASADVDMERLRSGALAAEAPLRLIVLLMGPEQHSVPPAPTDYRLVLADLEPGWAAGLAALPGIRVTAERRRDDLLIAELAVTDGRALAALEQHLAAQKALTLALEPRNVPQPRFDQPVQVRPLAPSEAAVRLLGHLQNGLRSPLIQESGDPRLLLATVWRLLADVACYEMRVGPLDEMTAAVRKLAHVIA